MTDEDLKNKTAPKTDPSKKGAEKKTPHKNATTKAGGAAKEKKATPVSQEQPSKTPSPTQNNAPKKSEAQVVLDFFKDPILPLDQIPDHDESILRHNKMIQMIIWQGYVMIGLIVLIFALFPVLRPTFVYSTHRALPEKDALSVLEAAQKHELGKPWGGDIPFSWGGTPSPLIDLDAPNVTKESLLSWSATAITEIMTMGFGAFNKNLIRHRRWFTDLGWQSYIEAIEKQGLRQDFLERQLVLTTAPSDMPLIAGEGLNERGQYVWYVSMPVVMNFMTNNNVKSRKDATVQLEIIRVDPRENPAGIAINTWTVL